MHVCAISRHLLRYPPATLNLPLRSIVQRIAESIKATQGIVVALLTTEDTVSDIVGISASLTLLKTGERDVSSVAIGYCQDRSLEYSLLSVGIIGFAVFATMLGTILRRLGILPMPSAEADTLYLRVWLLPAGTASAFAIPWLLSIDMLELDTVAPHYSAEVLTLFGWYVESTSHPIEVHGYLPDDVCVSLSLLLRAPIGAGH